MSSDARRCFALVLRLFAGSVLFPSRLLADVAPSFEQVGFDLEYQTALTLIGISSCCSFASFYWLRKTLGPDPDENTPRARQFIVTSLSFMIIFLLMHYFNNAAYAVVALSLLFIVPVFLVILLYRCLMVAFSSTDNDGEKIRVLNPWMRLTLFFIVFALTWYSSVLFVKSLSHQEVTNNRLEARKRSFQERQQRLEENQRQQEQKKQE